MAKKRKSKATNELFAIGQRAAGDTEVTVHGTGTFSFLRPHLRVAATAAKADPGYWIAVEGFDLAVSLIQSRDYSEDAANAKRY